jgi:hypothetical protein
MVAARRPVFFRRTKLLAVVAFILLMGFPLSAEPPDRITRKGAEEGTVDARNDPSINPWGSYALGCVGVGLILPWSFGVSVPTDRMIGRTSEYVGAYANAYVRQVRGARFLWGCLGTTTTIIVGIVFDYAVVTPAIESCSNAASGISNTYSSCLNTSGHVVTGCMR